MFSLWSKLPGDDEGVALRPLGRCGAEARGGDDDREVDCRMGGEDDLRTGCCESPEMQAEQGLRSSWRFSTSSCDEFCSARLNPLFYAHNHGIASLPGSIHPPPLTFSAVFAVSGAEPLLPREYSNVSLDTGCGAFTRSVMHRNCD